MNMLRKFRLALRAEGNFWNAYAADMNTMEGAIFIGSISLTAAQDATIKSDFMALMQRTFEVLLPLPIERWNPPQDAPPHERSGNA